MSLTLRASKGSALTQAEMDANFSGLADGTLISGLSNSSGSSLVGFVQSGTGAVAETVQSALRRVSVQPQHFMSSAQKTDVSAYTGSLDVYTAIMEAYDALPSAGGTIELPPGKYRYATMPVFSKPIVLIGSGAGTTAGKRPTLLAPDAGVGGLSLTLDANYSVLRDFYLLSGSVGAGTDDGITSKAHGIDIQGVVVDNFGRYGVAMDSVTGNCNNSALRRVRAVNNRSHGFYLKDNDTNVCHLDTCDATTNGGYGFYLSGCIQNLLTNPSASLNTTGAYYDNGNSNKYINPYVELGVGDTVLFDTGSSYAIWISDGYTGTDAVITDNGGTTQIFRKGGWHKKLTVNDAAGPGSANKYSLVTGSYLAGYLSLANETTSTNLWNIDGSSLRQQMMIHLQMGSKRFSAAQGADVASANTMTLGSDGNYFRITGATQINLIDVTNWQGGSQVTLFFVSNPTVKTNQVASGVNRAIVLNAAVDFVAAASNTLTLVYDSTNLAWYEVARKV